MRAFHRFPRTTSWLVVSALLLGVIAWSSPVQLPVVLYKAALLALGTVIGYWADRGLFPYARPDSYLVSEWRGGGRNTPDGKADFPVITGYRWIFGAALLRRAVIVGAVVVGLALGM